MHFHLKLHIFQAKMTKSIGLNSATLAAGWGFPKALTGGGAHIMEKWYEKIEEISERDSIGGRGKEIIITYKWHSRT